MSVNMTGRKEGCANLRDLPDAVDASSKFPKLVAVLWRVGRAPGDVRVHGLSTL